MGSPVTLSNIRRGDLLVVRNVSKDTAVASRVRAAVTPWARLRGLLGHRPLDQAEGLLLRPCRSVHTMMMRYPIDVVFLAADGAVVGTIAELRPWRTTKYYDALATLEVRAGQIASSATAVGDRLEFDRPQC